MKVYQVGGAVRDGLLGLAINDRDWVVVGGSESQMLALGFTRVEGDFPVFLHPETGDQYALARKEIKSGVGYKGFTFQTGIDISLEQDLQRRDLTINAIARNERGEIIDPCHGQVDIENRLLRHITPAFAEDPLRLLRVARFTARFSHLGFRLSHATFKLMKQMAQKDELTSLSAERVWRELKGALGAPQPWRFFEVVQRSGAMAKLLPSLDLSMRAHAGHGKGDDHAMEGLKRAVAEGLSPEGRFAVFILSYFTPDAAVDEVTRMLPLERSFQEALTDLSQEQETCALALRRDVPATLRLIQHCRALQHPQRIWALLEAYKVFSGEFLDQPDKWFPQALECVRNVTAETSGLYGLKGKEIGQTLQSQRVLALQQLSLKLA